MMDQWKELQNRKPEEFKVVLTQHQNDLYPVAAFYLYDGGKMIWMREIEGPEDLVRTGKYEELYQIPTHWMSLPERPLIQEGRENAITIYNRKRNRLSGGIRF